MIKWFFRITSVGALAGTVVLIKDHVFGGKYCGDEELENKVVVITGANTGIGYATAMELSKRKATVVLACRDMKKCANARREIMLETRNKKVHCQECDLADISSIHKFSENFSKVADRVDVLINNAGVMRCPKSFTKDGFETQLGTNHFGHFLLTNLLLDRLKKASPSRVINVSSTAHAKGSINYADLNSSKEYSPSEAYNQSKLANILFTIELAEKLKGTGVTCNAVNPGLTNTELARHMSIYNSFFATVFLWPMLWLVLKSPAQGAQTTIYAALSPDLTSVSGKYFSGNEETPPTISDEDLASSKRLWAISERWTRLS